MLFICQENYDATKFNLFLIVLKNLPSEMASNSDKLPYTAAFRVRFYSPPDNKWTGSEAYCGHY